MVINDKIVQLISDVLKDLNIEVKTITLEHPEELLHGDYSTPVALTLAKELKKKPVELANLIVQELNKKLPEEIKEVKVAGPGFVNFYLNDSFIHGEIIEAVKRGNSFGRSSVDENREIMIEYTDPNTFKVFHIGHLMANAVGESISRLIEFSGAKVVRICYPSDIGLHIAKSIWAIQKNIDLMPADSVSIQEKTDYLGKMYVLGTKEYDSNPEAKKEIDIINKDIYEKSNTTLNSLYNKGRQWSLDHFELLYQLLDTKFDETIYESEMAGIGLEEVNKNLEKGIFEKSDGAVVFKGEKYDSSLHTRVFINNHGVPTYEAKDLGLNITKFKRHPNANKSIIVTANEQNDYFKVLLKAVSVIDKENGTKTRHIGHGMMRFLSGKMSSRTGNVVTADSLISDIKELVANKIADRKMTKEEIETASNLIAIGAIKYSILRSSIGSNIVFDSATSISFEGDSGPYLQYSAVRARSIIEKAKNEGIIFDDEISKLPDKISLLEKLIVKFPEVVERAREEYAPQLVATYLINLSGAFNSFYASQVIVDKKDDLSPYYVLLTKVFLTLMTNGLWILGIKVPEKM